MAKAKPENKSDSPSRDKREGESFPQVLQRSGSRVHHDRPLTGAEAREQAKQREAENEKVRKAAQKARDREPQSWPERRRAREG